MFYLPVSLNQGVTVLAGIVQLLVFVFFLCCDLVGRRETISLAKREGLWTLQGAAFGLTVLRRTVMLFPDSSTSKASFSYSNTRSVRLENF